MDKLLSMIGLARKAGKLFTGYDVSVEKIRKGTAKLAIAAADVSEKTYKNLSYEADRAGIRTLRIERSMEALGKACGRSAGVVAVTDEGFANAIARKAEQKTNDLPEEDRNI